MQLSEEIVPFLSQVIQQNHEISLPAFGTSMFPFIKQGNICIFQPIETCQLQEGDIILYYSVFNKLVAHRIHKISRDHITFICKGDSNLGFDPPVSQQQIIGVLMYVQKGNKMFYVNRPMAKFWSKLLLTSPLLSKLIHTYLRVEKKYTR